MRIKRCYILRLFLWAGWGTSVKDSDPWEDIIVLTKDGHFVELGIHTLTIFRKSRGSRDVLYFTPYKGIGQDPDNIYCLINQDRETIDLRFPDLGPSKKDRFENIPERSFAMMRNLLIQFMDLNHQPPTKTELVDFIRARVKESRTVVAELLKRGEGKFWATETTRNSYGTGKKYIIRPR